MGFIKDELQRIKKIIQITDKDLILVLISVPIITTLSWYLASENFFRENLANRIHISFLSDALTKQTYWMLFDSLLFLVIPLLIVKLNRWKIKSLGLNWGEVKSGLSYFFLFFIPTLIIIWIISSFEQFSNYYPSFPESAESFSTLMNYSILLLIYVFAWEFLWRGYFLFSLEKKFGFYSIFIQLIPFVLMHNGKPFIETFSAIAGGIILGYIALRTRSFIYGFLMHFTLLYSIEIISIIRYQNNEYGIGFNAIINILS